MNVRRLVDIRLQELERRSAEAGQPVTIQRRAALKALVRRSDYPTADAIYADVISEHPGVSKATVYRALDNLVHLGLARRVLHEGPVARYDGNQEKHHHLVCRGCGRIEDVAWEALDAIPVPDLAGASFEIHDFFVSFEGLCRRCSTRGRSSARNVRRKK